MVDTNDEWITSRTGIKERRILKEKGQGTSFLAIKAANDLIKKRGINPEEIELVIVATATPDMKAASTAAFTATQIGAINAFSFDLEAACSSFLFGMSTAAKYIESGRYKNVLLIGADKNSSFINYEDRATCIIFGDGAGAALFEPDTEGLGLQDEYLRSDGAGREYLKIAAGGSILPASEDTLKNGQHFIHQEGKTVFKHAVSNMADVSEKMLTRNNLTKEDIQWLVPHQANLRISQFIQQKFKLSDDQVYNNIMNYGNTTAASIPIALTEAWEKGKIKEGDLVVLAAFGSGFTWGSVIIRW